MCRAVIQHRNDGVFDLELHYCQLPEPPRVIQIEHIGTAMRDRAEAKVRAEAKYAQHDCAKRFGCTLTWEERQPKPNSKSESSFFEKAIRGD
ncbi:hypothetical protein [Pseudoxanthomonas kaohsiungensis]|uniref:hypothetical protein n=1 Tax=Pseudoxanthomonas kaohsiungensis TaxID=283923 RepID=UPI0013912214|nr:hypothetical protein [Pseudoxanthomonas kaohsiungensis]